MDVVSFCLIRTCCRTAPAMLDERGSRSGTAMRSPFRFVKAVFIFEALVWRAPLPKIPSPRSKVVGVQSPDGDG